MSAPQDLLKIDDCTVKKIVGINKYRTHFLPCIHPILSKPNVIVDLEQALRVNNTPAFKIHNFRFKICSAMIL